MYIFSSSTRNQHPNHGVVAGAEKPRRRKKKIPATATSSSENQVSPPLSPHPPIISSGCLVHPTSPLLVLGPIQRVQFSMTLSPAISQLPFKKTLIVILVIFRILVLNRLISLRVLRALQLGHRLRLFLVRIVGQIRGGKLPGVTWNC